MLNTIMLDIRAGYLPFVYPISSELDIPFFIVNMKYTLSYENWPALIVIPMIFLILQRVI